MTAILRANVERTDKGVLLHVISPILEEYHKKMEFPIGTLKRKYDENSQYYKSNNPIRRAYTSKWPNAYLLNDTGQINYSFLMGVGIGNGLTFRYPRLMLTHQQCVMILDQIKLEFSNYYNAEIKDVIKWE